MRAIEGLIRLKRSGLAIGNTESDLQGMIRYFRDPAAWRLLVQGHTANNPLVSCSGVGQFQVQANGDVQACPRHPPLGNIRQTRPRDIWRSRPHVWEHCCLVERASAEERSRLVVPVAEGAAEELIR